jgi:tetratricopeptide (TPR) repeat protein
MDTDLLEISRASAKGNFQAGRFRKALDAEKKALQIVQEQYGLFHPSLVPILNDIATLERCLADYPRSEQDYRWGLAIRERYLGPDDPKVAQSYGDLAGLDIDLGRWNEAEVYLRKELDILEKAKAPSSGTAPVLESLGGLYVLAGRLTDARSVLQRCLSLEKGAWGEDSPRSAGALLLLSRVSEDQGDLGTAEDLLRRILTMERGSTSPGSLESAGAMENLAAFYLRHGRKDEALGLYRASADIRDRLLGTDRYDILPNLHAAALTDMALGRSKEAENLLERVLGARESVWGPAHPKVAFALEDLAALHHSTGHDRRAVAELERAKGILERVLGSDHPEVAKAGKELEALH